MTFNRMNRIGMMMLAGLGGVVAGGAAADAEPVPTTMPTTIPATVPAAPLSPRQTIEALVRASQTGDAAVYRAVINAQGELETQLLDTAAALVAGSAKFRQAAVARYGEKQVIRHGLTFDRMALPLDAVTGLADAVEQIEGDAARLTDPGSSRGIELQRVDGRWMIPLSRLIPSVKTKPDLIRQNMKALRGFATVLEETADDVGNGHFRTAEEAAMILKLRLQRAHENSGASDAPAPALRDAAEKPRVGP